MNNFYLNTDEDNILKKVYIHKDKKAMYLKPLAKIDEDFDLSKASNHSFLNKGISLALSLFGSY